MDGTTQHASLTFVSPDGRGYIVGQPVKPGGGRNNLRDRPFEQHRTAAVTVSKNPPARYYEDAKPGELVGPVNYGPMTIMHLVRWCAAMENWHRIHYDYLFCREHEGLPGPVINGSWKQ